MLKGTKFKLVFGVCALLVTPLIFAQSTEVKEKPPMFSYVSFWTIPRAQWPELEKSGSAEADLLGKALSSGTLIGYGSDRTLVHQAEGPTHDRWWSAMSLAGLLNVLDSIYKSGQATSPALLSATKHWDGIYVSRYYNWHAGSWKGAYGHVSSYKLKPDAPDDAVEKLSKNMVGPLLEKMLADGVIFEYEIDTEAIHTEAPGRFWIVYVSQNPEGLDKVNAAIRETLKANPLSGPAFGSMTDFSAHRDYLSRTEATYK